MSVVITAVAVVIQIEAVTEVGTRVVEMPTLVYNTSGMPTYL